jgi:hypothetical protein
MSNHRVWVIAVLGLAAPLWAASCSSSDGGGTGGTGGTGGAGGAGGAELKWYTTCGDPVCGGHMPHPGVPTCTTEAEGIACATEGAQCDPVNDCNALLVCATSDPKQQPGGCPISRARWKHDIRYLDEAALDRVHDDVVAMPLATWRYNHEGAAGPEHLGFLIDDVEGTPAVADTGDRVDLYGYTSMAIAAIQAQERQIAALQGEVKALREELAKTRAASKAGAR